MMTEIPTDSQVLAGKIKNFINFRRDNKEVTLLKNKPDKKGQGGINNRLISFVQSRSKDDEDIKKQLETIKKERKAKEIPDLEFQQNKYKKLLTLTKGMAQEIVQEYAATLESINGVHDISEWLTEAAKRAGGRTFATHVIRLTHSSISATSILDKSIITKPGYLTTSNIPNKTRDVTGNAGVSHYTDLLDLEHGGKSIADYIIEDDGSPFIPYASSDDQLNEWVQGFKKVMEPIVKSSHTLAKQVYFPLDKKLGSTYHLLLPIVSSSLAHQIYISLKSSDANNERKEARKTSKYMEGEVVFHPNKAVIKVTASIKAHPNVSILNKERFGQLSLLLSSPPPAWKSKIKPPLNIESLFFGEIRFIARNEISDLRKFLLLIKKKELNPKDPKLHRYLLSLVDNIVDRLFTYVSTIQQTTPSGWSAKSKLKLSHQLWLDSLREDENFQQQHGSDEWQVEICADFADWLNKQLSSKKLTLSLAQENFWKKIMRQRLREFEAIREVQS